MLWESLEFAFGLALLSFGAHFFLTGAAGIARVMGMSPYLIGLTVVGFGTSAPELAVNLSAAIRGSDEISLGNVVGSNIANIGLILGLSAFLKPLKVQMRLLRVEAPIMLATAVLLWILILDGNASRVDGIILLTGFAAMTGYIYAGAQQRESEKVRQELGEIAKVKPSAVASMTKTAAGLAALVIGARLMVASATEFARALGISELVIGLTIVAVGTSLPELASSLLAAWKNEPDIALGNVVGSNIFNILLILGLTIVILPLSAPHALLYADVPVMIIMSGACFYALQEGMKMSKSEGLLLLAAYAIFVLLQANRG